MSSFHIQFECIQKLAGHSGEIWALAVSHKANFVVTGSHDKSIRIWEKTDEPVRTSHAIPCSPSKNLWLSEHVVPIQLFLEEERERELEEMYANASNPRGDRDELRVLPSGEEVPVDESTEVTKSTTETLMAGERILEALELSEADRTALRAYHDEVRRMPNEEMAKRVPYPTRNAVFSMYDNCSAEEYVLKVVRAIPPAQLQDALLVLPFGNVVQLIEHIDVWAHKVSLRARALRQCLACVGLTCTIPLSYAGLATRPHLAGVVLPPADSPLPDRRDSRPPPDNGRSEGSPARRAQEAKGSSPSLSISALQKKGNVLPRFACPSSCAEHARVQPRCAQVPPAPARGEQGRRVLREGCPRYRHEWRWKHGGREGRPGHDRGERKEAQACDDEVLKRTHSPVGR